MIKFTNNRRFFLLVIVFLSILNLALILKIPGILQLSGLVALCIAPGYLLCLLFRIQVTDKIENFLYYTGLSIVFDLFFGLAINTLLPVFGNNTPLSPESLQLWYSLIILVLTFSILYKDRAPAIIWHPLNLNRIEKMFIIFGLTLLICVETGIYLVNADTSNLVLIFSILVIPLLLLLCILYDSDAIKRVYPFIVVLISASLMLILALRSDFILGIDVHEEYYLFLTTLTNAVWVPDPSLLLSAALSISLLPTLFENFLFIDPQILFKLLFPLLFLTTPLIIYCMVKKYYSELLALIAACLYMFQRYFLGVSANARTSVAIFFVALFVLVLCDREMSNAKKYALLLLFIAGMVFSHYTTSFIFLFILILTYLMDRVFTRTENRKENPLVTLPLLIFFMSLIFFWYQQIINTVFSSGLKFTMFRTNIFNDLVKNDLGSYSPPSPAVLPPPSVLLKLVNYSRLALYALIGLGVLYALYRRVSKKYSPSSTSDRSGTMSGPLIFMGLISCILLFLAIFAPFLFYQYDTGRLSELLFTILPVFLITGVCLLINPAMWEKSLPASTKFFQPVTDFFRTHRKVSAAALLLLLLVPQLLFSTYITNQIDGSQYSIALNPPRFLKGIDLGDPGKYSYFFNQDATALQWFRDYSDNGTRIFGDPFGNKKITGIVERRSGLYQPSLLDLHENDIRQAYVFLTVINGYFGTFNKYSGEETEISVMNPVINRKNKIFTNGAVIYR